MIMFHSYIVFKTFNNLNPNLWQKYLIVLQIYLAEKTTFMFIPKTQKTKVYRDKKLLGQKTKV